MCLLWYITYGEFSEFVREKKIHIAYIFQVWYNSKYPNLHWLCVYGYWPPRYITWSLQIYYIIIMQFIFSRKYVSMYTFLFFLRIRRPSFVAHFQFGKKIKVQTNCGTQHDRKLQSCRPSTVGTQWAKKGVVRLPQRLKLTFKKKFLLPQAP